MGPLLVFPSPTAPDVVRALELSGYAWKGVDSLEEERQLRPLHGWPIAVLIVMNDLSEAVDAARDLRADQPDTPILFLVPAAILDRIAEHGHAFDDFCLLPFHPAEFKIRLELLTAPSLARATDTSEEIRYEGLSINPSTYQAAIDGTPLDLTYMEYELLKQFASNPGRVFSRQVLLSEVWGYDYYGGARTVDVHVRRLRAKLGEGHADLISTVRSVGYRFGQSRWDRPRATR